MCFEILILFCILIARADFNDLLLREVTWKPASQNSLKTQQTANEYRLAAASHRVHFCNTKLKNDFKPAFFWRHNSGLLWRSHHVQRLMSCSQRAKVNEWDRCVLICCSVSGRCARSRGCGLPNHILTRQLLWKRGRRRACETERLESWRVEAFRSLAVMIRI